MRDEMLAAIPNVSGIRIARGTTPLCVLLTSPYPVTLARIQALLQADDLDAIIAGFPVRESGILSDIARSLRFIGDVDYEKLPLR